MGQLNGPWFDSWWSLCLMGPEKKSTTESFGSPLDGGRPQVHHRKLWLSVRWWPTTSPPRKALALRWMVADHKSTMKSFGSPLDGGRPQVHHEKLWLSVGWWPTTGPPLKALALRWNPAKESRSGARQAKVQVEGIAYSFCGLWISSVLACLCVTSQLNGPWFDSWWSLCLMGPENKSTTESFGSPLDGGRPQVHDGKLWLSVGWWPTTGPPRKALALCWMVADHEKLWLSVGW